MERSSGWENFHSNAPHAFTAEPHDAPLIKPFS